MIESIMYHRCTSVSVGDRLSSVYVVLKSRKIDIPLSMLPPTGGDLVAILTTTEQDFLNDPLCDSLLAFHPILGRYDHQSASNVYVTVLYWNDDFWIPAMETLPIGDELSPLIFGTDIPKSAKVDFVYKISACNLPHVDDHFKHHINEF